MRISRDSLFAQNILNGLEGKEEYKEMKKGFERLFKDKKLN